MNSKDVSDKIKKDLVIIEEKLLNHYAFKSESLPALNNEADDIRSLTCTYQNMLCNLNLNEEDYDYCVLRCKTIDKIYEQIKIRSEYYLNNNHNQFYKKIMDAFNNAIRIHDYYDHKIKELEKQIVKAPPLKRFKCFKCKTEYTHEERFFYKKKNGERCDICKICLQKMCESRDKNFDMLGFEKVLDILGYEYNGQLLIKVFSVLSSYNKFELGRYIREISRI